jgi:hypothetical protein
MGVCPAPSLFLTFSKYSLFQRGLQDLCVVKWD